MRWSLVLVAALALLPACDPGATATATATDTAVEDAPDIAALRAGGRASLERLIADGAPDELVDAVAQQRDAKASGLFWETDLDHALAMARERDVPVLSLRMLGALTDEHSCANSRFFRTLLYTDPQLANFLDERFVLHWSTERPVPQVEIDFGDGRVLRTTTTGNSAHYVLDHDGNVLDVLPGLYDARTFQAELETISTLHATISNRPEDRDALLASHHRIASFLVEQRLESIMGPDLLAWMSRAPGRTDDQPVPALMAQSITASKAMVETPALLFAFPGEPPAREPVEDRLRAVAGTVTFSKAAEHLVRRDRPQRNGESDEAYAQRIDTLLEKAAESVAYDTLINEARLRYQIHAWFVAGEVEGDFETLNERIYRELFATPAGDPWLGLVDDTVYDGLSEEGEGLRGLRRGSKTSG